MTDLHDEQTLLGRTVAERFRCDELLGVGGMGQVYKATQLSVDRPVALKVLRAELGGQKEAEDRFMREARTVAGIAHPGIVQLVDFGRDPYRDVLYLAMEFVEGVSLANVMKLGRIRRGAALGIARQIAAALAQAHRAGVVHRDLKPDNVMLVITADGALQVKVLDFGIALPSGEDTRLTRTGAIVGTPHYMSPEQAQDQFVGPASDVYALGVILYEMLAGRLPFVADTPLALLFKHVQTPPPDLRESVPDIEADIEAFVRGLLAKSPGERPGPAGEIASALGQFESAAGGIPDALTEVGATRPEAFLPLVDVQRATSEAHDVFGVTAESSPPGSIDEGQVSERLSAADVPQDQSSQSSKSVAVSGSAEFVPGAADTPRPSNRGTGGDFAEPPGQGDADLRNSGDGTGPLATTRVSGPSTPVLLAALVVMLGGIGLFGWIAWRHLGPPSPPSVSDSAVKQGSGTTSAMAAEAAALKRSIAVVEARAEARADVELATLNAERGARQAAAIPVVDKKSSKPSDRVGEPEQPSAPADAPADAVTAIGPRADELEVPNDTKVVKEVAAKPPRIPPPTDDDTLQRRMRAAGGMCTGNNKCQFDATEPPGAAVCKDDSTCVARCPNGGCLQFCQDRATCWFSCEGGGCNRMVDPDATMTEFKD